jgi:hypothetical protein
LQQTAGRVGWRTACRRSLASRLLASRLQRISGRRLGVVVQRNASNARHRNVSRSILSSCFWERSSWVLWIDCSAKQTLA